MTEEQKTRELEVLFARLSQNERKIIDYAAGIRTAEQHASDVEERVQIYQEIKKKEKE